MIIPSIDLMGGRAVQLVGGEVLRIDAGDPMPIAERFAVAGEIAVVDLDAAMGKGDNRSTIRELTRIAPCRVGGGIRDADTACRVLDDGATAVVLGTRAVPEVLERLPRERVFAALDTKGDEVVVEGWKKGTGHGVLERIGVLRPYVAGFLVTFVELEGRMQGTDLERARAIASAAGDRAVTIAGGITTPDEIRALDAIGCDAQVGMALYEGTLAVGDGLAAVLRSDRPDGLWPTVVVDAAGSALGLAYSNAESLRAACAEQRGVYWSRRRGLWRKGETSGSVQRLLRVDVDCDRDALRFVVAQDGAGFCHRPGSWSCFGSPGTSFGDGALGRLERTIAERTESAPEGSYTQRLLASPELLRAKLVEEAGELSEAVTSRRVVEEAADLIYFATVQMQKHGVGFAEVGRELDRRARRVVRRGGDAKPSGDANGGAL